MTRPWRMFLAQKRERCCSCDRVIEIDELVIDDLVCIVCIACAGPLLTRFEIHEERAA